MASRKIVAAVVLISCTSIGGAGAARAQNAALQFAADSRRLETDVTAAQRSWDEQRRLYDELLAAAHALESALADADATANELRALEDRYAVALEAAVAQARQTSESRRRVYDGMDRLAASGRQLDQERRAASEVPIPGGLWRIEVAEGDLVGLMRLNVDGAVVSGDYRLNNGRHGSLSGSFSAGKLDLVRIDSQSGRDASLSAVVDRDSGTLRGSWQRNELASGGPAMGTWSAVRLGPGDDLPALDGDAAERR